jgi:hypothetical protein
MSNGIASTFTRLRRVPLRASLVAVTACGMHEPSFAPDNAPVLSILDLFDVTRERSDRARNGV